MCPKCAKFASFFFCEKSGHLSNSKIILLFMSYCKPFICQGSDFQVMGQNTLAQPGSRIF